MELEEDHRIDAGATTSGVEILDQISHEREVEGILQAAVEVVLGDELFEGEIG